MNWAPILLLSALAAERVFPSRWQHLPRGEGACGHNASKGMRAHGRVQSHRAGSVDMNICTHIYIGNEQVHQCLLGCDCLVCLLASKISGDLGPVASLALPPSEGHSTPARSRLMHAGRLDALGVGMPIIKKQASVRE